MTLQPANTARGIEALRYATIACVERFAFGTVIRKSHPTAALKMPTYGQTHRAIDGAGINVTQGQTNISSYLRGIVDLTMRQ